MDDQSHSNGIKETEVKPLKILGGIQIGIGIVCVCMSLIGIVLDMASLDKKCTYNSDYYYYSYYNRIPSGTTCYRYTELLLAFDVSCLILSGWFILTGLLPVCMTSTRKNNWKCLKISFMVCSIIGAAVFILAVIGMGISNALIRAFENDDTTAVIPAVLAIASGIELIVAIISASYCCCCSSWGSQISPATFYIYIRNNDTGVIFGMPVSQVPADYFQSQNMSVIPYGMHQLWAQSGNHQMMSQSGPIHSGAQHGNHQMMPQSGPIQQWAQQGNHQTVHQPGPSQQIPSARYQVENHQMVVEQGTRVVDPQNGIGPEGQMMTQRSFVNQNQTIEPSEPPKDHSRTSENQ